MGDQDIRVSLPGVVEGAHRALPTNPKNWSHEEAMNWLRNLHILSDTELEQMEAQRLAGKGLALLSSYPTVMLNYYEQKFNFSFETIAALREPLLDLQGFALNS
jgi:hypothetical protein